MNINKLMYGVSEDKFFGDNFDIELDDATNNEFTVSSKSDIDLLLGCNVVMSIKLLRSGMISVRFGNDYGNHMNIVYVKKVFDMDKFIDWLKCSLRDFLWQESN